MVSVIAARLGGSDDLVDWSGPKVGGRPALVLLTTNESGELMQRQFTATMTAP